jgi:uncharacterized protein (DUF58 family)
MQLRRRVDEEVLACIGRIGIAARQAVEHLLSGSHRGLRRGLSVEFVGHRAYEAGDDLRHLDWQVLARTDRHAVRVYEEETRLRATLVVDTSASMRYGEHAEGGKANYAQLLGAVLATIMVAQGDSVSLALCDDALRRHLPPDSSTGHLIRLLLALESCRSRGHTDLLQSIEQLAPRLRRRGLVLLLTDGGEQPGRLVRALHLLRSRRQEVHCFLIRHPHEQQFPFHGPLRLVGWESGQHIDVDADRVRAIYHQAQAEFQRMVQAGAHAAGVRLTACSSDEALQAVLLRAFSGRAAREPNP